MPDEDQTQITIGRFRVGISGLKAAIAAMEDWRGRPDEDIAQELLSRLKPQNYIPAAAQAEYRKAFLREFKKAMGETVAEEPAGLSLKVLGAGCPACDQLTQTVMAVLEELGLPAAVEHVRDPKEIVACGVLHVPALLINNEVRAAGRLPGKQQLREWLIQISSNRK